MGTQTAAIRAGGYGGPPVGYQGNAEQYNGSSWTNIASINTARSRPGGSGTTSAGLIFGGEPGNYALAESFDGSNWSTAPSLGTGRRGLAGAGTSSLALAFGGRTNPGPVNNTEEFTGETTAANVKDFTTS